MNNRTTPEQITTLQPTQVFVFGSNKVGKHGKGAAKTALGFGAKWGVGIGLQGQSYGIPTKGHRMDKSLPLSDIKIYVDDFIEFARKTPGLTFLVTEIGCGLAGYSPKDIAPLFKGAVKINNIHLPPRFWHKLEVQ